MNAPLKIALVGLGLIGRRHLHVLQSDPAYRVAGIVDPTPAIKDFCARAGIPHFVDSQTMLAMARPDGTIVAVPNQAHVEVGSVWLRAGVPVLMEKPIADGLVGAAELVAIAESSGTPMAVAHHRRHNPVMRRAREILDQGTIGRQLAVSAIWLTDKPDDYFDIPWHRQPGAGPVLINSIHDIDNLRMLCGEIDSVQAMTANTLRNHPVEDTAAVTLRFASGALGTLLLSDAVPSSIGWETTIRESDRFPQYKGDCYVISGTGGSLSIPSLDLKLRRPGETWSDPLNEIGGEPEAGDAYVAQMQNFAEVIREQAPPVVSGQDGLRSLAVTLAILESAKTGHEVRVADLLAAADRKTQPTELAGQ